MPLLLERTVDDSCIIPDSISDTCIENRSEHDTELWSFLQHIACFESGEATQKSQFSAIESKLDEIIRVLNDNNRVYKAISQKLDNLPMPISTTTTPQEHHPEVDENPVKKLQKDISKVKRLTGKYLRADQMSSYTEQLMALSPPFVQRKFRIKVNSDTHPDEIESYEKDAIGRATRETERLKIRMKRWDQELAKLNDSINTGLANPIIKGPDKVKLEQQLKRDEVINEKKSLKAFQRIQQSCDKELDSGGSQFLLKFIQTRHLEPERRRMHQKSKYGSRYHHPRRKNPVSPS